MIIIIKVSTNLDENIKFLEEKFKDCGDIVKRKIPIGKDLSMGMFVIYIDMLIDRGLLEEQVLRSLMLTINEAPPSEKALSENIYKALINVGVATADISETDDMSTVVAQILSGDTPLFFNGYDKVVIISTKGWPNRGIPTATTEVVVQGSKEAFSEVFRFNSMLIRRRIKDSNLKIQQMKVGKNSVTDVGVMYLEGVVRPKILKEVLSKIKNINIDGIFDVGYVEQLIEKDYLSPFPQAQVTERPDKAASSILEGRIVIIVDNSPFFLIVPATLNVFFQASEDYYQRFEIMSFIRVIRYIGSFIAIALPGLYIAMALYHPSMLSLSLILKMSEARANVPIPPLIEILLMELSFELLREGGIRLPAPAGSTIGIVGGIVIGQAAVEAGLVSPIVVIVVAFTAVATFAIPSNSLVSSIRITKYLITILSALLGLFGFCIGILIVLIHLVSLNSFGIPYLYPFVSGEINNYTDYKDTIFRLPLFMMKDKPFFATKQKKSQLKKGGSNDIS